MEMVLRYLWLMIRVGALLLFVAYWFAWAWRASAKARLAQERRAAYLTFAALLCGLFAGWLLSGGGDVTGPLLVGGVMGAITLVPFELGARIRRRPSK